jgi:hypothetical protein
LNELDLPRPEDVNFGGMRRKEQTAYYHERVRELLSLVLESDDLPEKFRHALEIINDYTFYLGD